MLITGRNFSSEAYSSYTVLRLHLQILFDERLQWKNYLRITEEILKTSDEWFRYWSEAVIALVIILNNNYNNTTLLAHVKKNFIKSSVFIYIWF